MSHEAEVTMVTANGSKRTKCCNLNVQLQKHERTTSKMCFALLPPLISHALDVTTTHVNTVMLMLKGYILLPSSLSTPTGVGRISDDFLDDLGQMAFCE